MFKVKSKGTPKRLAVATKRLFISMNESSLHFYHVNMFGNENPLKLCKYHQSKLKSFKFTTSIE